MPSAPDLGVRRATATILTGTQGDGDVWAALPIAALAIAVTHRTRTIPLARKNSIPEPNIAAIAGVFATGMTVRVVSAMVPALANPIATQTSARHAMAMVAARSVAAMRTKSAAMENVIVRRTVSIATTLPKPRCPTATQIRIAAEMGTVAPTDKPAAEVVAAATQRPRNAATGHAVIRSGLKRLYLQ